MSGYSLRSKRSNSPVQRNDKNSTKKTKKIKTEEIKNNIEQDLDHVVNDSVADTKPQGKITFSIVSNRFR